jgi:hypothetical protein
VYLWSGVSYGWGGRGKGLITQLTGTDHGTLFTSRTGAVVGGFHHAGTGPPG